MTSCLRVLLRLRSLLCLIFLLCPSEYPKMSSVLGRKVRPWGCDDCRGHRMVFGLPQSGKPALATKSSMSLTLTRWVTYQSTMRKYRLNWIATGGYHPRLNLRLPLNLSFGAMLNFSLDRVQFFDQSTPDVMPRFLLAARTSNRYPSCSGLHMKSSMAYRSVSH